MIVHRAGPLKQQNKAHKHGKHRSKGQREEGGNLTQGFQEVSEPKSFM